MRDREAREGTEEAPDLRVGQGKAYITSVRLAACLVTPGVTSTCQDEHEAKQNKNHIKMYNGCRSVAGGQEMETMEDRISRGRRLKRNLPNGT